MAESGTPVERKRKLGTPDSNDNVQLLTPTAADDGRRPSLSQRRKFSQPLVQLPNPSSDSKLRRRRCDSAPRQPRARSRTVDDGLELALPSGGDHSVSEMEVAGTATEVIHSFLVCSRERELRQEMMSDEDSPSPVYLTPSIPELDNFPGDPLSPGSLIGRRLAEMGDDLQERYGEELDRMVGMVLPQMLYANLDTFVQEAYDAFRNVSRRLFANGQITWGRIVALLSFGYRMIVALFRHGLRGVTRAVVRLVAKFILGERIARWIADHGGWMAALNYRMEAEAGNMGGAWLFAVLGGVFLFSVLWSVYAARRSQ